LAHGYILDGDSLDVPDVMSGWEVRAVPQSREAARANWERENARLAQAHRDYRRYRRRRRRRRGEVTALTFSIFVLLVLYFLVLRSLLNLF
jgi:hypothetical protein